MIRGKGCGEDRRGLTHHPCRYLCARGISPRGRRRPDEGQLWVERGAWGAYLAAGEAADGDDHFGGSASFDMLYEGARSNSLHAGCKRRGSEEGRLSLLESCRERSKKFRAPATAKPRWYAGGKKLGPPSVEIISSFRTFWRTSRALRAEFYSGSLRLYRRWILCAAKVIAMAGTPETLNLKRKREGAEPHRKKAKREEKSKAAEAEAQNGTPGKVETATPVAKPTPKPTPTPKAKHGLSEKPQTNGARESAAGTPSSSRKDRKQSKLKGAHGLEITNAPAVRVEDQAAAEATPVREQKIVGGNAVAAESASKDSKTKKSEKQKWKERNRKSENVIKEKVPENSRTEESIAASSGHGDKEAQPSKKKKEKKSKGISSDRWSISGPHGGWFLPQDPVFSRDEKCLLLAKLQALEVYSTETSLLANELPLRGSAVILAYALSASEPNHVYIVDSAGIVTLRNWTNRSMIGRWDIGGNVRHLAVVTQPESALDLLYCYEAGGSHIINVHALRTANQSAPTELKCILKSSSPITGLQVFLQGKIVVVSSADSIMIGKPTKLHKTALQDLGYTWQEFKTSKRITAFNAHIRLPENLKGKNLEQDPRDHLDLAIGDEEGAIHLFEDILASFAAIEKSQKGGKDKSIGPESLRPKRLHWHRDAVGSLKWSLDGKQSARVFGTCD